MKIFQFRVSLIGRGDGTVDKTVSMRDFNVSVRKGSLKAIQCLRGYQNSIAIAAILKLDNDSLPYD